MSGTWIATKDAPSGLAPAPTAPLGERFAIQQSGETLTLTRLIRDTTVATAYVLDGRETRARIPGPLCQGDMETIEAAAHTSDGVVITMIGQVPPGGGTVARRDIQRTIRRAGPDTLVVESRMMVQGNRALSAPSIERPPTHSRIRRPRRQRSRPPSRRSAGLPARGRTP